MYLGWEKKNYQNILLVIFFIFSVKSKKHLLVRQLSQIVLTCREKLLVDLTALKVWKRSRKNLKFDFQFVKYSYVYVFMNK